MIGRIIVAFWAIVALAVLAPLWEVPFIIVGFFWQLARDGEWGVLGFFAFGAMFYLTIAYIAAAISGAVFSTQDGKR